jgi:hypothetical protein
MIPNDNDSRHIIDGSQPEGEARVDERQATLPPEGAGQADEQQPPAPHEGASVSIPPDLLDLDIDWHDERLLPEDAEVLPGATRETRTAPRRYGLALLILAVLAAAATWTVGYMQRQGLLAVVPRPGSLPPTSITLVDLQNGVILMLEQSGSFSRVVVEPSDQASWLLVSRDDTTATNPALSSDGKQVAYVTERDGGQLVIVSIITDTRRTIDADQVQDAGDSIGFEKMQVCPWTPIAWAPTGNRIAFFGCTKDASLSVVLVGDLSDPAIPLTVIARSKAQASAVRQIKWLDHTHLVVSTSATDAQQAIVSTFVVP